MVSNNNNKFEVIENMDSISQQRFFKLLDDISSRLSGIESQLVDVVRMQEHMKSTDEALRRYGKRLDDHGERLRDTELWRAERQNTSPTDRLIKHIQTDVAGLKNNQIAMKSLDEKVGSLSANIDRLTDRIDTMEKDESREEGQKDVAKSVLKWAVGLLSSALLYLLSLYGRGG